jgi:nitrogen regulatory protein P-II 2
VKMIVAIIQPLKLRPLQEALSRVDVERMTVCDSQGFGRQRGQTAMYRGIEYKTNLLRKVTVEIVVNDDFLQRTLDIIEATARTGPDGNIGDGKVFVLPVDEVYRIGSDTIGPEAV